MRVKDLSGHRIHQTLGLRQQCQRSHMDVAEVVDIVNAADIPGTVSYTHLSFLVSIRVSRSIRLAWNFKTSAVSFSFLP